MWILLLGVLIIPFIFSDPENFSIPNALSSPLHIQPEWYFLCFYAMLRAIPHKLLGVMCLLFGVLIFYSLNIFKLYRPLIHTK